MSLLNKYRAPTVRTFISAAIASSVAASALLLSGCGDDDSGVRMSGVVAASGYVPGSTTGNPTLKAGYYQGAVVCIDANGDGKCDNGETSATTDSSGKFSLKASDYSDLLVDIGTNATNSATGTALTGRLALRASKAQVTAAATAIVVSPMSSEVQRLVEQNSSDFATEKANLATKVGVTGDQVLADVNTLSGAAQYLVLTEENALTNRYAYATVKFDRGDLYPDAMAVAGNNPELIGVSGLSPATAPPDGATDTRKPITFLQAQQAAFNLEGIPRYDSIFIVMLENKGTKSIAGSQYAPNINAYLNAGNQFMTYFATGNPSEPNYTALGGGDDFGITDDNWWRCGSKGGNEPTDQGLAGDLKASDGQPLVNVDKIPPVTITTADGKTHTLEPGTQSCVDADAGPGNVNHNIQSENLFTLMSKSGMTFRVYNESMTPGQDPRTDSTGDPAVVGTYTGAGSDAPQPVAAPDGLYKTKHHPGMAYQSARNLPEFYADNRTMFGTQYGADELSKSTVYTIPPGYNYDQFSTDLESGDVGTLNFVVPDQCDDMHSVGSDPSCTGNAIIQRGDDYVRQVVEKIQASPLWKNPQKHVAIVLMFDEGTATLSASSDPYNSCCGWVPGSSGSVVSANPLKQNADGSFSADTSVVAYGQGNHGHGNSIFGVLTNSGPKGIKDTDAYSHFSFVRTLQDMFGLADPEKDGSYLNRARYTEKFIAQNILNLPEYQSSADTHFDSVRPMNHAYVIPAEYLQKQSTDIVTPPQRGPDASQTSVWAIK